MYDSYSFLICFIQFDILMAFWIFSWTLWFVWIFSIIIIISAINWDDEIIATSEELNLFRHGPLWTYFGNKTENVSIFHSREYVQKRVGKLKDVDPERLFLTFVP